DRCFTLKGIGTVVTGTLWSGELSAGDEARIEPRGTSARIRSVQVHDRAVERAAAGQRVALNLAGIQRDEVERGDVGTTGPRLARLGVLLDEARSGLAAGVEEEPLLERLAAEGRAARLGSVPARWFSPVRLEEARGLIAGALERARGRPAGRGALARDAALDEDAAALLLDSMVAADRARTLGTGFVATGGHARDHPLAARVLAELDGDGFEP